MIPRSRLSCALRLPIPHAAQSPPGRAFSQHHKLKSQDNDKPSSHGHSPDSPLTDTVRTLMRSVPHPLTVILSSPLNAPDKPAGLLVSSFNTITLHPTPYVSFNIKLPSSTYTAIENSKTFTVSAIWDFAVAETFAKCGHWKNYIGQNGKLKKGFAGGAIWWMRCAWVKEKCVQVGDHVVVVGKVLEANEYNGETKTLAGVYVNGEYRRVRKLLKERTSHE